MAPNCDLFARSVLFNFLLQNKTPFIGNKLWYWSYIWSYLICACWAPWPSTCLHFLFTFARATSGTYRSTSDDIRMFLVEVLLKFGQLIQVPFLFCKFLPRVSKFLPRQRSTSTSSKTRGSKPREKELNIEPKRNILVLFLNNFTTISAYNGGLYNSDV